MVQPQKPPLQFVLTFTAQTLEPAVRLEVGHINTLTGKVITKLDQTPMGILVEHEDKSAGILGIVPPVYLHFGPMPTVLRASSADVPPEPGKKVIRV